MGSLAFPISTPHPHRSNDNYMPEHIRAFLVALGVADQPHSGRTLLDHLDGTYQLLLKDGETVALAGALHSIYGTQFYKPQHMPTRSQVRELIGVDAEWLVYLFCGLPRNQYGGVAPEIAHQLFLIAQANKTEQKT